jgi:uncharacterized membrane protein YjgN (DUF898 family)
MTGDMRFGSMPFRFSGRAGPLYGVYALCWLATLVVFIVFAVVVGVAIASTFGDALKAAFATPEDPHSRMTIGFFIFGLIAAFLLFTAVSALTWAFYVAREMTVFASYTTLDQARFQLDATTGSLILLTLGNLLLIVFTLGIATPFAQQRLVRYLCTRLSAHGTVDVDQILQSREVVGRTGEGLADAFDVSWI